MFMTQHFICSKLASFLFLLISYNDVITANAPEDVPDSTVEKIHGQNEQPNEDSKYLIQYFLDQNANIPALAESRQMLPNRFRMPQSFPIDVGNPFIIETLEDPYRTDQDARFMGWFEKEDKKKKEEKEEEHRNYIIISNHHQLSSSDHHHEVKKPIYRPRPKPIIQPIIIDRQQYDHYDNYDEPVHTVTHTVTSLSVNTPTVARAVQQSFYMDPYGRFIYGDTPGFIPQTTMMQHNPQYMGIRGSLPSNFEQNSDSVRTVYVESPHDDRMMTYGNVGNSPMYQIYAPNRGNIRRYRRVHGVHGNRDASLFNGYMPNNNNNNGGYSHPPQSQQPQVSVTTVYVTEPANMITKYVSHKKPEEDNHESYMELSNTFDTVQKGFEYLGKDIKKKFSKGVDSIKSHFEAKETKDKKKHKEQDIYPDHITIPGATMSIQYTVISQPGMKGQMKEFAEKYKSKKKQDFEDHSHFETYDYFDYYDDYDYYEGMNGGVYARALAPNFRFDRRHY